MTANFYTFFKQHRSDLLISGYENGHKFNRKVKLKPYLFVDNNKESEYKNIEGSYVGRVDFSSPYEARQFIKDHEIMDNFKVYGSTYFDYVHINDAYPEIVSNNKLLRIGNYDIETDSEGLNGKIEYGNVETADKAIISITIHVLCDNEVYCFGYYDYNPDKDEILKAECPDKKVVYIHCENEEELLREFIKLWVNLKLDAITGWNINGYDHLYLIRRINRVLGERYSLKLSPFEQITSHVFTNGFGKETTNFEIIGIPTLDYIECYKKFSFKNQESYKLDYIAKVELGKQKLRVGVQSNLDRFIKSSKTVKIPKEGNPKNFKRVEKLAYIRSKIKDELNRR